MVADEQGDSPELLEASHEARECMPCRGTGRLISNLGGTPSMVTCPWCEGGGIRLAGVDAQARWAAERAGEPGASGEPDSQQPPAAEHSAGSASAEPADTHS